MATQAAQQLMREPGPFVRVATPSFFKADHPRVIDRYIDYFGDRQHLENAGERHGRGRSPDDACGERLLDVAAGAERLCRIGPS